MSKSFTAKVVSLGRITIPKEVREEQGIKEGDQVRVENITKLRLVEAKEA